MTPPSVIALFCEDIREETGGRITLIGIVPDNIQGHVSPDASPESTPTIPKLCIYTRLQFDPNDENIEVTKSSLVFPNNETRDVDMFNAALIAKAREGARAKGAPIAGVFASITMANFPVLAEGRFQVHLTIGGTKYLAGAIHMKMIKGEPPSIS